MLRAEGVEAVLPSGRKLVGPVGLEVGAGSLTALVGPSGAGKTTLLRMLAGITVPTAGTVTLDGEDAEKRIEELGYVPQQETVHTRLTVREALRYAALLRLEAGADVAARTAQVLEELDLVDQADTLIGDLSGGERRRAACGAELVGRPRVLLLDEPTSGLDPVLERRLMLLFRRLADQGRAVIVSTHATASLDLCDAVAVMSAGELTLTTDPAEAVARLRGPVPEVEVPPERAPAAAAVPRGPAGRRPFGLELRVLTQRYARTVWRDRRTLAVLLGQAPIIGALIVLLFPTSAFSIDTGQPQDAVQLVFLVMTGAVWLGITAACREVVKERAIVEREFDVGLRADAYVLAKAAVLIVLATVQVLLLLVVVLIVEPLEVSVGAELTLAGLAVLTAWVSVGVGLVVSTLARSVDQAAGVVPLVLIPQLLFAGAVIPLERMPGLARIASELTYSRWACAGMGSAISMNERLGADRNVRAALGYGDTFFSLKPGAAAAALVCFLLITLGIAATALQYRPPADST